MRTLLWVIDAPFQHHNKMSTWCLTSRSAECVMCWTALKACFKEQQVLIRHLQPGTTVPYGLCKTKQKQWRRRHLAGSPTPETPLKYIIWEGPFDNAGLRGTPSSMPRSMNVFGMWTADIQWHVNSLLRLKTSAAGKGADVTHESAKLQTVYAGDGGQTRIVQANKKKIPGRMRRK